MLIVNRIGEGAARYYQDGKARGAWVGGGCGTLGLAGVVDGDALEVVLRGADPRSGARLAERAVPHRRAGWDLIFAAPKSVSVVAGLAPPPTSAAIVDAHRRATDDAVGWIEGHACWARRGGALVATSGVVAARYDHHRSAAGDPHLHTHLVLANLACAGDGRWSGLDGSSLWVHRRSVAAAYHLALRHHLRSAGLDEWRIAPDGTFDLAAVPRAAIEASSRRGAQVAAALDAAVERPRSARRAARVRTRPPAAGDWWAAVGAAGFGPATAAAAVGARGAVASPRALGPEAEPAVTAWLLAHRSTFGTVDALAALAATLPAGAPPAAAQRWAEELCERSPRARDGRRTTPAAVGADSDLRRRVDRGRGQGLGTAPEEITRGVLAARPELGERAAAPLRQLTGSGDAVDVVRPGPDPAPGSRYEPLVAEAALLDAARAAWQRAGHTVAVLAPPGASARWGALAALEPARDLAQSPTVVVVDRADRLSTPQLTAVLDRAERIPAKVVLVCGGTLPPRRRALSEAFEDLRGAVAPPSPAVASPGAGPQLAVGAFVVCGGTHQAIDELVGRWGGRTGAVMAGLGPAEVVELNRRARGLLRRAGELRGADAQLAGRAFAIGDRVIPLARTGGPPGAEGTVTAVDARARRVTVSWGGRTTDVDSWAARYLGHAYAVTPAGLALRPGPVLVLGDPAALGRHAGRLEVASLLAPTALLAPTLRAPGAELDRFHHDALRRLAEIHEATRPRGAPVRSLDVGRGLGAGLSR